MIDDRLVNSVAEAALLGAMMIDNRVVTEWCDRLRAEDFADPLHGRIYTAMLRFQAKGMRADALTLLPVFQQDSAARYGDYLHELVESPAAVAGANAIANQVVDFSARRQTRLAMHEAMESLSKDFDKSIAEIAGGIEQSVWAAESRGEVVEEFDAGDLVGMAIERDERINADPGAVGTSNALISDLDRG